MEGPASPALAVMDQKEPVGTADVVNITAKANDLPTWLELLRDAMKGFERDGLNTTKITNILLEKYPDEFHSVKLRAELVALLKEGMKYGICVKLGANWILCEENLAKNAQGNALFSQCPTYRRQRKGRRGRPRKSDVNSISIDMNDLEKDLNDSRAKVPTVTEDTKKEPSSPPSSAPEKVSVEAEKGLFTQNGWLRAPLASAHIGSRVRVIRALASLTEKDVCTVTPTGEVVQSPPRSLATTTATTKHSSATSLSITSDAVACYYLGDRHRSFLCAFSSIQSAIEDCHLSSCEAIKRECDEGRSPHSTSKILFQCALSIPIAGILLALSSRRSAKGSDVCEEAGPLFAGLRWEYDSKESKRSRHASEFLPIEVIRAMIAVGSTALSLCKQWKIKIESITKHKQIQEASKQKKIQISDVGEKIDCLTLDGVLLHTFDSLSDIRAELGLQLLNDIEQLDELIANDDAQALILTGGAQVTKTKDAPPSTVVHVPGRSMLSINIKALQNVCVKRMDPNFSAKRFVKAPASDSVEEEKPDDISQATINSVEKHAAMRAEGWLFSTEDNEFIDGTIEAYLPYDANDSVPLWHVRHDDGDREDVDFLPMLKYLLFLREGYHYDPEEVDGKKEKDSGKNTVQASEGKEKDSSTVLQVVDGSSAEVDQSAVKFEDENIEDALTDIVEQMQIDFRKMRGFKGTFPNLAAIVLYCLKTSIGEINAGLNINEISRYISIILESRGHQEIKFSKSLLFVISKLTSNKKITKHNESCCPQEVYYTFVDVPNLMTSPTILTALDRRFEARGLLIAQRQLFAQL
eukprot:gene30320-39546_t